MSTTVRSFRSICVAFCIGALILFTGCGREAQAPPPENKATATYGANASANAPLNAENVAPETANSDTSGEPGNLVVNMAVMKNALRERLMRDAKKLLSKADWDHDAWLEKNIGAFYKNDDEMVKSQVCDLTEQILKAKKMKLKGWSRQRLYDSVNGATKCKTVISLAYAATADAVTTKPIP